MIVARAVDASGAGESFFSIWRPRLAQPELRSRVAGYLATAPQAGPDHRTDGVWVWPDLLADEARRRGVGPEQELLDHLASRDFLPPLTVPADAITEAARVVMLPRSERPVPAAEVQSFARVECGDSALGALIRLTREIDATVREEVWGPYGWEPADQLPSAEHVTRRGSEITAEQAARLADDWCAVWHARFLDEARESADAADRHGQLRMARVYDRESPARAHWFSPNRLRIIEPERRQRLGAYLMAGRLVLRATGHMVDPLEPTRGPVVPLSYRTDGSWIWSEALAYYVRERGVAPELEFLCHLEERGLRPPSRPSDATVHAAMAVIRQHQPARLDSVPFRYYLDEAQVLGRVPHEDVLAGQVLQDDLRWRISDDLYRDARRGQRRFREIDEATAAGELDHRWGRLTEHH